MHGWCYLPFRTHPDEDEARRDVNQHAARARQVDIFQQRRRDSHFSSFFHTVFTARHARTHHCVAHLRHYGAYVCKVTFIKPGRVISSAIPCTAPFSTSFAAPDASGGRYRGPELQQFVVRDGLIRESTCLDSSVIPCSANAIRFLPSKLKGLVTTATVRIPNLLPLQRRLVLHLYRYHHPYPQQ